MTFLIVTVSILVLFFLIMLYFFNVAFIRHSEDGIDDINSEQNLFLSRHKQIITEGMDYIDDSPHKWVYTTSFDGLKLAARYYDTGSDRCIILFHGYRSSAKRDFSCAVKMYCDLGLNVLLVDQRSHGKSEGKYITFGVNESCDVISWLDFLIKEHPETDSIFLGGMSMGATTVLLSTRFTLPSQVKGIIADCGFTSPKAIIKKVAKQKFFISGIIVIPIMDILCRIFGKFSISGISAEEALKQSDVPILLIHGTADNFVPCEMSKQNYGAARGKKQLYLVDGADHGMSFLADTKGVVGKVYEFINSCQSA